MLGKLVGERLSRVGHRIAAEPGLPARHVDPVERDAGLGLAAGDAEADVGVARRTEHRPANGAAHSVGTVEVRPAAHHARNRVVGLLTPVRGVVRVGPVGARHPLPDVPRQVERTGRRCPSRVSSSRSRPADPGGENATRRVGRLVSPRPEPIVAAPRCSLPLRLGGKPCARPLAKGLRVVPRHVGDRSLVLATRARPCDRKPTPGGSGERAVLPIRHRDPAELECRERDRMARLLVRVGWIRASRVTPHQEGPCRHGHPLDPRRHAVAVGWKAGCQFTDASSQSMGSRAAADGEMRSTIDGHAGGLWLT